MLGLVIVKTMSFTTRLLHLGFENGFPYLIINMDMGPYDYKLSYN